MPDSGSRNCYNFPMHITSGNLKGMKLKIPPGQSLRPSQNQVRLAIFNILESNYLSGLYYDDLTVADLYAGTGVLGIEALSRGVTHVDFVEKDKGHIQLLRENVRSTQTEAHANIHATAVEKFLQWAAPQTYDLIFADPPYALSDKTPLQDILPLLKPHGVLVFLHGQHFVPPGPRVDHRQYGATTVSFYTTQHA